MLPRRVGAYSQAWLDQLTASGEVVWIGAGALGRNSGKVALYFRDDVAFVGPPSTKGMGDPPEEPIHVALRERLERGASFWSDLLVDVADVEPLQLQEALWDLVWAGEVTNDAWAPLRAPKLSLARAARDSGRRFAGRRRRPAAPQIQGRWSLTAPLFAGAPAHGPRMRALSEILLERYGIVTREQVLAEGVVGGFSTLYPELANLETLGTARRGYFVEGLGGAQFALSGAVERLRGLRDGRAGRRARAGGDRPGEPVRRGAAVAEARRRRGERPPPGARARRLRRDARRRGGALRRALRQGPGRPARAGRLAARGADGAGRGGAARPVPVRLQVERFDGEPIMGTSYEAVLIEAGFRQGPRRLTLSA